MKKTRQIISFILFMALSIYLASRSSFLKSNFSINGNTNNRLSFILWLVFALINLYLPIYDKHHHQLLFFLSAFATSLTVLLPYNEDIISFLTTIHVPLAIFALIVYQYLLLYQTMKVTDIQRSKQIIQIWMFGAMCFGGCWVICLMVNSLCEIIYICFINLIIYLILDSKSDPSKPL